MKPILQDDLSLDYSHGGTALSRRHRGGIGNQRLIIGIEDSDGPGHHPRP